MMRKVKVVKYGQQPAMSKPGYSRGFNSGQFPVYYPGTEWTKPGTEVSKGLKPVSWDEANVEAEGGETAYVPDQGGLPAHFNINGPRHSQGGVPLNLPPDTFIYSDTSKMKLKGPITEYFGKTNGKAYTPADLAKQYDINKYRKILQNPDSDDIQRHSAELMIQNYNKKLGALALAQEGKKGFPDGVPVAAIPFLMSYAIEPETVLPSMPQQQGMPMMQSPMPGAKKGGATGTWAAPNYYQIGGTYSAQTEPEFGGNWMGKARAKKQYGGEEEQILQVIQMYAQASGQDPDEIVSQLKQMQPEQAQQALQQMAQSLQGSQDDMSDMPAMAYGGYIPKAQIGAAGMQGLKRYTAGYKDITNIDDLVAAYNRLSNTSKNTSWYSFGWVPGSEMNQIKNMQLEIAKRIYNVSQTATNSEQKRKATNALHNLETSWYSLGWIPGSDEFGIGAKAVSADFATMKMKEAESDKQAAALLKGALPQYTKAYNEVMYNPDAFSAEDAQVIMDNYRNLKQLEQELNPKTRVVGTGALLPKLTNIPLTLPGIQPSNVVSKEKTKKKGTVPFTAADSLSAAQEPIAFPNVPAASPEQLDSLNQLLSKQVGGSTPWVKDEKGNLTVNLPEVNITGYRDPLTEHFYNVSKRNDGIEQLGFSDPAFVIPAMAAIGPVAFYQLYKGIKGIKNAHDRISQQVPGNSWTTPRPAKQKPMGPFLNPETVLDNTVSGDAFNIIKGVQPTVINAENYARTTPPSVIDLYKKYTSLPGYMSLMPEQDQIQVPYAPTQDTTTVTPSPVPAQIPDSIGAPNDVIVMDGQYVKLDSTGRPWRTVDSTYYKNWINSQQKKPFEVINGDTLEVVPVSNEDSLLNALGFRKGGSIKRYQPGGEIVEQNGKVYIKKDNKLYELKDPAAIARARASAQQTPQAAPATTTAGTTQTTPKKTAAAANATFDPNVKISDDPMWTTGIELLKKDFGSNEKLKDALYEKWKSRPENKNKSLDRDQVVENFLKAQEQVYAIQKSLSDDDRKSGKWDKGTKKNEVYLKTAQKLGFTPLTEDEIATFQSAYIALNDLYKDTKDPEIKSTLDKFNIRPVGVADEQFGDQKNISKVDSWFGNTTLGQAVTPKLEAAPPAPKKKGEERLKTETANYVAQPAGAPWWAQDLVNMYGAAGDFLRLKKYLPWAPETEPVVPEPVFYDPTRALAANAEQANIASQAASTFGAPQQFSAISSGIQGQAAKNAANILGEYEAKNVGVANTFAGQVAGIYNRNNEMDARRAQDLYDKTVTANQQFDNSRNQARQNLRQSYIAGLTNRAQAQAMNTMYPDYYVDPSTGGFVGFKPGVNPMETSSGNDASDFDTWMDAHKNIEPDKAAKVWLELQKNSKTGRTPSVRGRRSASESGYPSGYGYMPYPGVNPGYGYFG